jgi:hypothetical protein
VRAQCERASLANSDPSILAQYVPHHADISTQLHTNEDLLWDALCLMEQRGQTLAARAHAAMQSVCVAQLKIKACKRYSSLEGVCVCVCVCVRMCVCADIHICMHVFTSVRWTSLTLRAPLSLCSSLEAIVLPRLFSPLPDTQKITEALRIGAQLLAGARLPHAVARLRPEIERRREFKRHYENVSGRLCVCVCVCVCVCQYLALSIYLSLSLSLSLSLCLNPHLFRLV